MKYASIVDIGQRFQQICNAGLALNFRHVALSKELAEVIWLKGKSEYELASWLREDLDQWYDIFARCSNQDATFTPYVMRRLHS